MAHNRIDFENFYCDNHLDKSMFSVFLTEGRDKNINLSNALVDKISKESFNYVLEWEFDSYNADLQKNRFFAPSILYHCHINKFKDVDNYIGFLEYDLSFKREDDTSICTKIKDIVEKHKNERFIIFPSVRHKLNLLNTQATIQFNNEHWLIAFFK